MQFTELELKALRDSLPRGAAKSLAEKFSLKAGSVRNLLSGKGNNEEVILAAIDMAREYKSKIEQAKAGIAAL